MSDAKILLIGQGAADVGAGGGARRTYQLLYELRRMFGEASTAFCTIGDLRDAPASPGERIIDAGARLAARACKLAENPLHLFYKSGFSALSRNIARAYKTLLHTLPRLEVCIVEDPNLAQLRDINDAAGVRTIVAPWCLNAVTQYLPPLARGLGAVKARSDTWRDRSGVRAAFAFQGDEILLHARAESAWMLSLVEQGFLRSLGLSAEYLPYYPAGDALAQLLSMRGRRSAATVRPGLLVISGSPIHQNNLALVDFVNAVNFARLGGDVTIAVTGFEPELLGLSRFASARVRFLGRLDNAAFDDLLVAAHAVLVPQIAGFGCLTRIPEMLAAGISVLTDEMTASAAGAVPGAIYVPPGKDRWSGAIGAIENVPMVIPSATIDPWIAAAQEQAATVLRGLRLG